jgi:hypothetical protein
MIYYKRPRKHFLASIYQKPNLRSKIHFLTSELVVLGLGNKIRYFQREGKRKVIYKIVS